MDNLTDLSSLIEGSRVKGTNVYNMEGEKVGAIDDLMIEKQRGVIAYAVMSFGGFLGMGNDYYPLPWSMLKYDTAKGGYLVNITRAQLEGAPAYARDVQDWRDRNFETRVNDYYGSGPFWGV
jgi:sporulation protein YlmC with PRC-barrel domain